MEIFVVDKLMLIHKFTSQWMLLCFKAEWVFWATDDQRSVVIPYGLVPVFLLSAFSVALLILRLCVWVCTGMPGYAPHCLGISQTHRLPLTTQSAWSSIWISLIPSDRLETASWISSVSNVVVKWQQPLYLFIWNCGFQKIVLKLHELTYIISHIFHSNFFTTILSLPERLRWQIGQMAFLQSTPISGGYSTHLHLHLHLHQLNLVCSQ